jgi:hypothetical protein
VIRLSHQLVVGEVQLNSMVSRLHVHRIKEALVRHIKPLIGLNPVIEDASHSVQGGFELLVDLVLVVDLVHVLAQLRPERVSHCLILGHRHLVLVELADYQSSLGLLSLDFGLDLLGVGDY